MTKMLPGKLPRRALRVSRPKDAWPQAFRRGFYTRVNNARVTQEEAAA